MKSLSNIASATPLKITFSIIFALFLSSPSAEASPLDTTDTSRTDQQKIDFYLDCDYCPRNYIKSNITFVNYVRDRHDADVQLLLTRARTGGSGVEFTLMFHGRQNYAGRNDTLTYFSPETDSQDDRRKGLTHYIKLGLMQYVAVSDLANQIDITYKKPAADQPGEDRDRWNNWMFELSSFVSASGRQTRKSLSYYGSAEAERITKVWKIRFDLNTNIDWSRYELNDSTEFTSRRMSHDYHGIIAKSLSDHWSLGAFSNVNRSSYQNIDFSAAVSPVVEYNIFPYSEYNTREFSFRYRITPKYNDYRNETIYLKHEEYLLQQALSARMEYTQPWGTVDFMIRHSNYMHDFDLNRLTFNSSLELKIFKGFSIDLYGRYSFINDQISIPRDDATDKEVLLNLRQQATSYSFYGRVGISYSFGAIYNNIVNPRL